MDSNRNELPEPCGECAAYGGNHRVTDRGAERCCCRRGQVLTQRDRDRTAPPPANFVPLIDAAVATQAVEGLSAMQFFPSGETPRTMIGSEIMALCSSPQQALWLVSRMLRLYEKWPGIPEMRRVFGSRYRPADGCEPIGISETYPDGIPVERRPALPAADQKALPPGAPVTEDATLDKAVKLVARAKAMPKAQLPDTRFSKQLAEILTPPRARPELPQPEPISNERRMEIQRQIEGELRKAGRLNGAAGERD